MLKITDDNHPLVPTLPEQQLRIKRWKRKDHGNPEYWKPMENQLMEIFSDWKIPDSRDPDQVDFVVTDFVELINNALFMSHNIERKSTGFNTNMIWNPLIYNYRCDVKNAYINWKDAKDSKIKDQSEMELSKAKKVLRYAIRKENRKRIKLLIGSIESLRSKDPSNYWKKLYQLDNLDQVDNNVPLFVRNSSQKLVSGNEALSIWKESFRLLGLDDATSNTFSAEFSQHVSQEVERFSALGDNDM